MTNNASYEMKNGLRVLAFSAVASFGLAFGAADANAVAVHPGALPAGITVLPSDFIDWAFESKDDFGSLGDAQVLAAMQDTDWFNDPTITALANVGSGNCGFGLVTCGGDDAPGMYTGTASSDDDANLFVVHVGGKEDKGGGVYAFLYNYLLDDFSFDPLKTGVSWIRAYRAPEFLLDPPEVPIPAALPLLLTGLMGIGFLGRMRRKVN